LLMMLQTPGLDALLADLHGNLQSPHEITVLNPADQQNRWLRMARPVSRLLTHRVRLAIINNERDDAYQYAADGFRLANLLKNRSSRIAFLIRNAQEAIATGALQLYCGRYELSSNQREELVYMLKPRDHEFPMRMVLAHTGTVFYDALGLLGDEPLDQLFGFHHHDRATGLAYLVRIREAGDRPRQEAIAESFDSFLKKLRKRRPELEDPLEHLYLAGMFQKEKQWRARREVLRQVLSGKPQLDPFTGSPLLTATTAEGTIVYSVGRNGVDDGGIWDHPKDDIGFAVDTLKTSRKLESER
jgi:hypothetical protein